MCHCKCFSDYNYSKSAKHTAATACKSASRGSRYFRLRRARDAVGERTPPRPGWVPLAPPAAGSPGQVLAFSEVLRSREPGHYMHAVCKGVWRSRECL